MVYWLYETHTSSEDDAASAPMVARTAVAAAVHAVLPQLKSSLRPAVEAAIAAVVDWAICCWVPTAAMDREQAGEREAARWRTLERARADPHRSIVVVVVVCRQVVAAVEFLF